MIYSDTHAVVWLYAGLLDRFTPAALRRLEAEEILISPMAVMELQYLYEIRRLKVNAAMVVEALSGAIGL